MIDASAIQELRRNNWATTVDVNGRQRLVAPKEWVDLTPKIASPIPITISTLTGLVAYVVSNADDIQLSRCLFVVETPHQVNLVGPLESEDRNFNRAIFALAAYEFQETWGNFLPADEFVIMLQTDFEQTKERDHLLQIIGSIREGSVRDTLDDGIKQEVKTARGVSLVGMTAVPNPIILQPFRTFIEVEQPRSQFVVRVKPGEDKPRIALFDAGGGAWKRTAIAGIRDYLQGALDALPAATARPSIVA